MTAAAEHPSASAASSRVFPSRQQRTSGPRNPSGSPASSSSTARSNSRPTASPGASRPGAAASGGKGRAREARPRAACRPDGDGVKPPAQGPAVAEAACLPGQGQERGLEGVLAVGLARQDAPADAPHQGGVALDQLLERRRVTPPGELAQQLGVRGVRAPRAQNAAQDHV